MNRLAAIAVCRSNFPICAAVARAARKASPSATTWLTRPICCALVALKLRPVNNRSRTTALPRSRFRRGIPPNPGINPKPQFGKTKTRHLVGDDQIAGQRKFKSSAERYAVHRGNRR